MITLSRNEAIAAVRKNFDEQELNPSSMYGESTDNAEFEGIIDKTIPEAINAVNSAAPVNMLEGDITSMTSPQISDGVVSFSVYAKALRLVYFQASDSPVVLTEFVPVASAEARKQSNPFVRGTFDNPVLVQVTPTTFKYYTVKSTTEDTDDFRVSFLKICEHKDIPSGATDVTYDGVPILKQAIIYQLTGMVLAIYGESDKAQYFFNLAKFE